jgi:hypothetical protein
MACGVATGQGQPLRIVCAVEGGVQELAQMARMDRILPSSDMTGAVLGEF